MPNPKFIYRILARRAKTIILVLKRKDGLISALQMII